MGQVGLTGRATEPWIGNAQNSTVTLRVNHAKRKESLLPYPGRSHKPLQQRQAMRQQLVKASEKSADVIVVSRNEPPKTNDNPF